MSQEKRRAEAHELIKRIYHKAPYRDRTQWLAYNLGVLEGILARRAEHDYELMRELDKRAENVR